MNWKTENEYCDTDNKYFKNIYESIDDDSYYFGDTKDRCRDCYFNNFGMIRCAYQTGLINESQARLLSNDVEEIFGFANDGEKYDVFAKYDGEEVADTGNRYEDFIEGLINKTLDDIEIGRLTGDRERNDKYEELSGMLDFICGWQLGSTQPDPYSPRPTDTDPSEHNKELFNKIRKIW